MRFCTTHPPSMNPHISVRTRPQLSEICKKYRAYFRGYNHTVFVAMLYRNEGWVSAAEAPHLATAANLASAILMAKFFGCPFPLVRQRLSHSDST